MYLPLFFSGLFFSVQFFNFCCTLLPRLIFYYHIYQKTFLCIYNPSRRLDVRCIKSNNIWLCFISSSFRTSVSYLYWLRSIIYCSNNTSLLSILIHGKRISNGFIFLDEIQKYLSYSTSKNQDGSLTCEKYKKIFAFSRSNENSIFATTAHKSLICCLSFNMYLELWQSQFLKTSQTWNDKCLGGWSRTVVFAPLHIHSNEEVNVFSIDN